MIPKRRMEQIEQYVDEIDENTKQIHNGIE